MAKCLRCGAGNEWLSGSVKADPPDGNKRIGELESMLKWIDSMIDYTDNGKLIRRRIRKVLRDKR
jgi:hypothetical protein